MTNTFIEHNAVSSFEYVIFFGFSDLNMNLNIFKGSVSTSNYFGVLYEFRPKYIFFVVFNAVLTTVRN